MKLLSLLATLTALAALPAGHASDALPYTTQPAFEGLSFNQPLGIVSAPGDTDRVFILEKPGRILLVPLGTPGKPAEVFLDLRARVADDRSEQGVLALAFHPDWKRNRQFYVYYTSNESGREDRLSRFSISDSNPNAADPGSEVPLIAQPDDAGNHNGGELLFGPDGYLYLSLGDEGGANDQYRNSQHIDRDFFSGILRLDVDKKPGSLAPNAHPAVKAGAYAIPADNPFVGATTFNGSPVAAGQVRTEFWAVGLRNPWRMSFDPATGQLWCADIGQQRFEEIDLIVRGGNYGWNIREGREPFRGETPEGVKFQEPIYIYPRDQGISVTGGLVYRGQRLAGLQGKYLFADYVFGRVWALDPDGTKPVGPERVKQIATAPQIVSFGRDPRNGDVLMASLSGEVLRLVPEGKVTAK